MSAPQLTTETVKQIQYLLHREVRECDNEEAKRQYTDILKEVTQYRHELNKRDKK